MTRPRAARSRRHARFARALATVATLLVAALATSGCGTDGSAGSPDAATNDADSSAGDASSLYSCPTPGSPCNAHDPCAIEPICGQDHLCRPRALQNCDDGLECTDDVCAGLGSCEHNPRAGSCALEVSGGSKAEPTFRCFADGDRSPDAACLVCDASRDGHAWSNVSGGPCDDGDACTKDDYCQDGQCVGTDYRQQCADDLGCTEDKCDGKGGCLGNPLKSDACLIDGVCYQDGQKDPMGCSVCDTSKSQSAWTPLIAHCLIGGTCYRPGDKDSTGCGVCDPTADDKGWTPVTGVCLIDGTCHQPGTADASGCGTCDPSASQTAWTPLANHCLIAGKCYKAGVQDPTGCTVCLPSANKNAWTTIPNTCAISGVCFRDQQTDRSGCFRCDHAINAKAWTLASGAKSYAYGFDSGLSGWTISNTSTTVGWVLSSKRSSAGTHALYYGNPSATNYDTPGSGNSGSVTSPPLSLVSGKRAGLYFDLYIDTEPFSNVDVLEVYVGNVKVWTKNAADVHYKVWQRIRVDLSSYAGQTVSIKLEFNTVDSSLNTSEGVYIDNLYVYHDC